MNPVSEVEPLSVVMGNPPKTGVLGGASRSFACQAANVTFATVSHVHKFRAFWPAGPRQRLAAAPML